MRSILVLVAMMALLGVAGCVSASKRAQAPVEDRPATELLTIQKVALSPKTLWPEKGDAAVVRWTLTSKADVTINIQREDGQVVRTFKGRFEKGTHQVSWDGADGAGNPLSSGVYLYTIEASDDRGATVIHDRSKTTGGETLTIDRFTFDKPSGRLDFVVPRASRLRLRIGLSPAQYLRTLLAWEPFEAGAQTLTWDGLDASGLIRVAEHPDLLINLWAFALPDNTVILRRDDESPRPARDKLLPGPIAREGLYFEELYDRFRCRDVMLQVDLPEAERNAEGLPIVEDRTQVRVTIDRDHRECFLNERFEVNFYIDTVFLFEEEDGLDPFNYVWDTTGLAPGEHLLTVNYLGYDDHLGVGTIRVFRAEAP